MGVPEKNALRFRGSRVRSFGVIWIRISDPRSLGSWFIKGTDESGDQIGLIGSFDITWSK